MKHNADEAVVVMSVEKFDKLRKELTRLKIEVEHQKRKIVGMKTELDDVTRQRERGEE